MGRKLSKADQEVLDGRKVLCRLVTALSADEHDRKPHEYQHAEITVTPDLCRQVIRRVEAVRNMGRDDPAVSETYFWFNENAVRWLAQDGAIDKLLDGQDTAVRPGKPVKESLERDVECVQMCVQEDGVKWVAIPRHHNVFVQTPLIEAACFYDMLEGKPPW